MKENETESVQVELKNTSGTCICVMFFGVMPSVLYFVHIKTPIICVLCLVEIEYGMKMENIHDHIELLQKELATSKESTCIIIISSHSLITLPCRK